MIRKYPIALVRCLFLLGLGLVGIVVAALAVVAATLVIPYPLVASAIMRLSDLARRLSNDWAGVEILAEDRTSPPVPQRREDGWYVHENQLYKGRWFPAFMLKLRWLSEEPTFSRMWVWMTITPFVGGAAVLVPPALIVGGLALGGVGGSRLPAAVAVAGGLVLVLLGFALAPAMVRVYGWWSWFVLQRSDRSWWRTSGVGPWLGRRWRAGWYGGGLAGLSFAAFGGFLLNVVVAVVSWGGLVPVASRVTRPLVELYRRKVRDWTGEDLPEPYRPFPRPPERDRDGNYRVGRSLHTDRSAAIRAQRYLWVRNDPATWRDLLWMVVAPLPSIVGLIPPALVSLGFFGLVWQVVWWAPWAVPIGLSSGIWVTPWYIWYGVRLLWPGFAVIPDWASVLVGLAMTAVGLLLALPLLRWRVAFDRLLLTPTTAARLAHRVERLTQTRTDAVDAQAAELRRIERDLHDGAQARLVAVGLSLAAIDRLMETDPDRARRLLAQARESSATALTELRDLVRGIHPPVLAERGLSDAVRAVALDSPLPVDVTVELDGRLDPSVESAAYFAICEAIANAIRHADAQRVEVEIRHDGDTLTAMVRDDGRGGADPDRGSGLSGIRRRLGTFDGVLTVRSPRGGPTMVTMEIPCALSSPKTSTS
jgi:signal transduction histidine kinase